MRKTLLIALLFATPTLAEPDKRVNLSEALKTCAGTVTDECVVRHFKDTMEASIIRGRLVYQNYCTLCHGKEGKGDGRAARLHTPPPANLTQSKAPRDYLAMVVRKGGEAMGRGGWWGRAPARFGRDSVYGIGAVGIAARAMPPPFESPIPTFGNSGTERATDISNWVTGGNNSGGMSGFSRRLRLSTHRRLSDRRRARGRS